MRIRGTIINSKNNAPVEGAIIKIIIEGTEVASVSSDEHGKFEYNTETDYIGKTLDLITEKSGFERKKVSYVINEPEIQQDILLNKSKIKIKGIVLADKTNNPLEAANITIKIDNETKEVVSKKGGSFSFNVSRQYLNDFIVYEATKKGYEAKSGKFQLKDVEDEVQLKIKLSPKKEKTKVKKDIKDEIKKPEEKATVDVNVGKEGNIGFSFSTASVPVKIALAIIAIIATASAIAGIILPYFQHPSLPPPSLMTSPDSVSLTLGTMHPGDSVSKQITLSNAGGGTLEWNVSADQPWITVNPRSGAGLGTVNIDVNTAGLQSGNYSGVITVSSNGGIRSGSISFNLVPSSPSPPILSISNNSFKFANTSTGESKVKILEISNNGGGTLDWRARTDSPWIELNHASGSNNGSIFVTINTTDLSPGSHAGIITIESNGGTGQVAIELNVPPPAPTQTSPAPTQTSPTPTPTSPTPTPTSPTPTPTPTPTVTPTITPTVTTPAPVLTNITVSPATASLEVDGTQTFTATPLDQYNSTIAASVTWSSSNQTVGTIDATGKFTASAAGTTTITAASESVSGTAIATVTLALIPIIYYVDANENPGSVYKLDNGYKTTFYTRASGRIYGLAFSPGAILYYSDANAFNLYKLESGQETIVYQHNTYLRRVKFDSKGNIYFSDASGAGSDGHIYRLDNGSSSYLYYTVKLTDVGFWAGDFGFDANDNLYLSNGNEQGASIYRVQNGVPNKIFYGNGESITGFSFDAKGNLYYTNFGQKIYQVDLSTGKSKLIYSNPDSSWISDVFIMNQKGVLS